MRQLFCSSYCYFEGQKKKKKKNQPLTLHAVEIVIFVRNNRASGDVVVYVKNDLKCVPSTSGDLDTEYIFLNLICTNSKILLRLIYKAPYIDDIDLMSGLSLLLHRNTKI